MLSNEDRMFTCEVVDFLILCLKRVVSGQVGYGWIGLVYLCRYTLRNL